MAENKLGVLVHGAGWVSTQHIKAFETNPHTEVVAISSRKLTSCQARATEAGLENVGLYDNYEQALKHCGPSRRGEDDSQLCLALESPL